MQNEIDPELDNPENYKFTIFYYNTKDKRVVVPKRNKYMGWTLNLGNHFTYLLLIGIMSVIILFKIFL